MELNNSILGINTQDPIINDIFKNDIQYTHITGSVNLCVNRCGQEIDSCNEIHLMNMVNNGKILILNQNPEKSQNNKCNLKKAYDDDVVGEEFSSYKFEKMFVITPSFNKIDGILYDCELGFIFSKIDKNGKKKYIVLCVLANSALDSRPETLSKSGDLLFYKLTNELFKDVPNFSNKKEIAYPPNPIDLSNFFPPYGERSFYEYTYKNMSHISYRIFQRPMIISNSALGNLREKLAPNKLYNQYKEALQAYENPKRNLLIFFKEDTDKQIIESLENQEESKISELDKVIDENEAENNKNEVENKSENEVENKSENEVENNKNDENKKIENYETDFDNIENLTDSIQDLNPKDDINNVIDDINDNILNKIDENEYIKSGLSKAEYLKKKEEELSKKIGLPKINNIMKMYVISILVIIFQLSNQLFLNYIVNKQISGYKPDAELMGYIYSKSPFASTVYFGNKLLNIISLFVLCILYVALVVKGTFYNFSDRIIEKHKSFKDILVTIIVFLFVAIFSNIISTISRLFLPSDKYGEISVVDSVLNIDSIILYFSSSKSIDANCLQENDYKLSDTLKDEKAKTIEEFSQYGGDPSLLNKATSGFKKHISNPISNLFGNIKEIFGIGLHKNLTIITSFIFYFVYVLIVFVLLFNQFDSSYAISPNNINVYGKLYKAFIGSYSILFAVFGLVFALSIMYSIYSMINDIVQTSSNYLLGQTSPLSVMKKLESLFRNPLFLVIFVIWIIILVLVILSGTLPQAKKLNGSKIFMYVGIGIVSLIFLSVILFLFEPFNNIYEKITGKKLFVSRQEVFVTTPQVQNEVFSQEAAKHIQNNILDPSNITSLLDRNTTKITTIDDAKSYIDKVRKLLNNNFLDQSVKDKLIEKLSVLKSNPNFASLLTNINIPNSPEKISLVKRGDDYKMLRGLLGSIGIDSDLLKLLENTPYSDEEINKLSDIVKQGFTTNNPGKIIEALKRQFAENHRSV